MGFGFASYRRLSPTHSRHNLSRVPQNQKKCRDKVQLDSRTDFLPCFMACEANVPRYALGVPLYIAIALATFA